MARRRPPPVLHTVLRSSRDTAGVWSEQDRAGRILVYALGMRLTAGPRPADPRVLRAVERMRSAFLFGGEASSDDLDAAMAAAFGDQPVHQLPRAQQLVSLGHVLKHWGVSVPWH
jgi:hypothetical protein